MLAIGEHAPPRPAGSEQQKLYLAFLRMIQVGIKDFKFFENVSPLLKQQTYTEFYPVQLINKQVFHCRSGLTPQ